MILFVGDSITHGTNWQDSIDFADVQNIAVPGYSTDDVLKQIPEIAKIQPKVISLLIGTNDFGNPEIDRSGEEVGYQVLSIISKLLETNKEFRLVVNSILPRDAVFTDRIKTANKIISTAASDQVLFLDCWPQLAVAKQLNPRYLLADGFDVHLSEAGYVAWRQILLPVLKTLV